MHSLGNCLRTEFSVSQNIVIIALMLLDLDQSFLIKSWFKYQRQINEVSYASSKSRASSLSSAVNLDVAILSEAKHRTSALILLPLLSDTQLLTRSQLQPRR